MFREPHPIYGRSEFMLKRWRKHTIYSLSGSYTRTETPGPFMAYSHSYQVGYNPPTMSFYKPGNSYSTNSIYLYDYVIVSDTFFFNSVYTTPTIDSTPALDSYFMWGINYTASFMHYPNTWKDSPNSIFNNFIYTYNPTLSLPIWQGGEGHDVYTEPVIYRDDGTYFEIVRGYPRNHYTHKRGYFALERFISYGLGAGNVTLASYRKGMQTAATTIGPNGLSDGSDPVQTSIVTNIDLIKSDNVIYR